MGDRLVIKWEYNQERGLVPFFEEIDKQFNEAHDTDMFWFQEVCVSTAYQGDIVVYMADMIVASWHALKDAADYPTFCRFKEWYTPSPWGDGYDTRLYETLVKHLL